MCTIFLPSFGPKSRVSDTTGSHSRDVLKTMDRTAGQIDNIGGPAERPNEARVLARRRGKEGYNARAGSRFCPSC